MSTISYSREYYLKNRESILSHRRQRHEERLKQDPDYYKKLYRKYHKVHKDKKWIGEKLLKIHNIK